MTQCDIEEKWMKELVYDKSSSQWKEIENTEIKRGDILDLSENGERWEGDSLNGSPYGHGCIYNSNNQLVYKGFMYKGKKVCFGTDFYHDIGIVEYQGEYYENKRCGSGKLYNKKNELVYEGEWYDNQPINIRKLEIHEELNENAIHFGLEEIMIGQNCMKKVKHFKLIGFNHLTKLEIDNNSLDKIRLFCIEECNALVDVVLKGMMKKSENMNNMRFCLEEICHGFRRGAEIIRGFIEEEEEEENRNGIRNGFGFGFGNGFGIRNRNENDNNDGIGNGNGNGNGIRNGFGFGFGNGIRFGIRNRNENDNNDGIGNGIDNNNENHNHNHNVNNNDNNNDNNNNNNNDNDTDTNTNTNANTDSDFDTDFDTENVDYLDSIIKHDKDFANRDEYFDYVTEIPVFTIKNCQSLQSLVIGNMWFTHCKRVELTNLPTITTFTIGYLSFHQAWKLSLSNLPKLTTFTTDKNAFYNLTSLHVNNVPFINGKYVHGYNAFFKLYSKEIQYDENSIELVNQIIPNIIQWSNDIVDDNPLAIDEEDNLTELKIKNWTSITAIDSSFEEVYDNIFWNDYPHVQYIHVERQSFKDISSLIISNLPELRFLIFEERSFYNTRSLILSNLPKLSALRFSNDTFCQATTVSLSNLPQLSSFIVGDHMFYETTSFILISML